MMILKFGSIRKFSFVTLIGFLVFSFQNCGKFSTSEGSSTSLTDSNTNGSGSFDGSENPPNISVPPTSEPVDISVSSPAPPMDEGLVWPPPFKALSSSACSGPLVGSNKTYDVGPGKTYTELNQVPWLSLVAGDVVNIYYRSQPYKTVIGLRPHGAAAKPVYINGVTDANCNRPWISGDGATVADDMKTTQFGISSGLSGAGLIVIFRLPSDDRDTYTPSYITIQNLKISGAKYTNTFKNHAGANVNYWDGAGGIYAVRVSHLAVENCEITDNSNGVFTNSRGQSAVDYSSFLYFRRNHVHLNGNRGRSTEHGFYTQAARVLFEGNKIGQAYGGSSLKDRSSGTVIRYNHVTASARALDLVETEEEYFQNISVDPLNDYAWVYGNIILNDFYQPLGMSGRPIHWGFDNNFNHARKNTLFFYGNTYINRSTSEKDSAGNSMYYVTVFQIGNNDDVVPSDASAIEASGNIFWNDSGGKQISEWRFLSNNAYGKMRFRGTNYIPTNRYADTSVDPKSNVGRYDYNGHTAIEGYAPMLDLNLFAPRMGSAVLDRGVSIGPSFTPAGANAENLKLVGQYTFPIGVQWRTKKGSAFDLGAIEQQ